LEKGLETGDLKLIFKNKIKMWENTPFARMFSLSGLPNNI